MICFDLSEFLQDTPYLSNFIFFLPLKTKSRNKYKQNKKQETCTHINTHTQIIETNKTNKIKSLYKVK